jgi:hypothetical protein
MQVLASALLLTALAFGVHLAVWRMRIPRRQTRALAWIFLVVPVVLAIVGAVAPNTVVDWCPSGPWQLLHAGCFYTAVALAYIVVYSALEERSPSMTLLSHAALAPRAGRSRAELEAALGSASPVEVRLAALIRDGLVEEREGMCRLTPKGYRWSVTFESLRQILGFGKGG